jgi:FkbM family methyltransferase
MTGAPNSSRLGAVSPRELIASMRLEFANWYTLGPLSWVAVPSRCPPRDGIPQLARKRVTVRIRGGYRAECRLDEFYPFVEVFALRAYDVPGVMWTQVRRIVDVGANVGAATLWFAREAPTATVVAVEPASRTSSTLSHNIRANRLQGRVRVVAAALAGRSGGVELEQAGPSVSRRTREPPTGSVEQVPALSLEDLLNRCALPEVDLLKLDCEGAEFDALLSTTDPVLRRNRVIVGEYHSKNRTELERLISRLQKAGFDASSWGNDSVGLFEAVRA